MTILKTGKSAKATQKKKVFACGEKKFSKKKKNPARKAGGEQLLKQGTSGNKNPPPGEWMGPL